MWRRKGFGRRKLIFGFSIFIGFKLQNWTKFKEFSGQITLRAVERTGNVQLFPYIPSFSFLFVQVVRFYFNYIRLQTKYFRKVPFCYSVF